MHALHAEAERLTRALLRRDGCRERRALFRSLEARLSRRAPGHSVAVAIRDRDRRVVERGADVRHTFGFDDALCLFSSCHMCFVIPSEARNLLFAALAADFHACLMSRA